MKERIRKKGIKKRLFSTLLALALVCSLMPAMSLTVMAAQKIDNTEPGTELYWEIDGDTLKITGNGKIPNYSSNNQPWTSSKPAITSIVIGDGVTKIGNNAFLYCTNATTVSIPASVQSIGEGAFSCCYKLTNVTIPNGVTEIPQGAFKECSALTSVTIPSSVKKIGNNAFLSCKALTNITDLSGVTEIGESAFRYCSNLSGINIPSVTTIGESAFEGSGLTSITIPGTVTSIGTGAFKLCKQLKSATISSGVTAIGMEMFQSCEALSSVTIPESVQSIEESAFNGCTSLTSISIPESVTTIGQGAFSNCSELTGITIPAGATLTSIGDYAFSDCSKLTGITIPANVTSIGDYAFYNCSNLTEVKMNRTIPPAAGEDMFYSCDKLSAIYVPNGSVAKYKAATNWSDYENKILGSFNSATSNMTGITLDNEDLSFETAKKFMKDTVSSQKEGDLVVYAYDSGNSTYKYMKYSSSDWSNVAQPMTLDELKEEVGKGVKVYVIGTIQKPSSGGGGGGGSYTPPATSATISGETGDTTNVSTTVSNGQATVSEIKEDVVEKIAESTTNGSDIVLNVSATGNNKEVSKVTLTKTTVNNIVDALESSSNNKENLVIITNTATVTLDTKALASVAEQAKTENIQIVVENKSESKLNESQKKAVEKLNSNNGNANGNVQDKVVQTFEAYITSGGSRISNFNGGVVTIGKIDFKIPNGKNGEHYHIYYIPESGDAQLYETWVEGGYMYFKTTHFSDYAIVYDESFANGQTTEMEVYRLYNSKNGEHLLTTDANEVRVLTGTGWTLENSPGKGLNAGVEVYRLFNPTTGEHLYTADKNECNVLTTSNGWVYDNNGKAIIFAPTAGKAMYRVFNSKLAPIASHHYTSDTNEVRVLTTERGYVSDNDGKAMFYLN